MLLKIILSLIILSNINLFALPKTRTFANIGIKIGYAFGEKSGIIYGMEGSYSSMKMDNDITTTAYGFVASVDYGRNQIQYHIGAEYYYGWVGFEWGPTMIVAQEKSDITHRATIYSWLGVIPYFSYTFQNKLDAYKEVGGYLKYSQQLTGSTQWK